MVLRFAFLVCLVGCSQSLFDNNGGKRDGGGGDDMPDAPVQTMCTAPCVGDGAGDFNGTAGGANGRWRYLEDTRNRAWTPMTPGMTMTGANPMNKIESCAQNASAPACAALPGALLFSSAGATAAADPAIELKAPMQQVVQISVRVHVPTGQPDQIVRLYRNSREDVLYTGTALPGTTLDATISIDALMNERVLFSVAPMAMGASQVGVQMFVSGTGAAFPSNCQLALSFASAMGNNVDNLCGGDFTHEDYNTGVMPPTLGAGPFAEQGMAADLIENKFYKGTNLVDRTGDTTLQLWVRHDTYISPYTGWPFSDMDLDNVGPGGLGVAIYDSGGMKLEIVTCTSGNPLMFAGDRMTYPTDGAWHFVRVVQKGTAVSVCFDGKREFGFTAPVGSLKSKYRPHVGKNVVWTPAGAFMDGGVDDVRVFSGALQCD